MDNCGDKVTIAEAAQLLGVHANTVRYRIRKGVYPAQRVLTAHGEAYVLPRALVDAEQQAAHTKNATNEVVGGVTLQA